MADNLIMSYVDEKYNQHVKVMYNDGTKRVKVLKLTLNPNSYLTTSNYSVDEMKSIEDRLKELGFTDFVLK